MGREFTFGDLFSGAGLFSAGMIKAGLRSEFAVELSQDAAKSFRRNLKSHIHVGSVTEDFSVPNVDVLIAGPPCQGFSTLGRRDPSDARNELCLAVLPWVSKVRPKVLVLENVPPFLRSPQFAKLSGELAAKGYEIQTWELEASRFGTPQFRRRAFTIASRIGELKEPQPFNELVSAGSVLNDPKAPIESSDPMHVWPEPSALAAQRIRLVPPKGDKRNIMIEAPEICPPSWRRVGCQATDVWGRIDPERPANTLRCAFQNPSKGRYLHPYEDRVLSLREGARLQGVPDDWIFEGRPYPVARQIGNGVPIPLASAVGMSVRDALARA